MDSELCSRNFALEKFQEIIPRNPWAQNSEKKSESPTDRLGSLAKFIVESGLDNFHGTFLRRGSCAAFWRDSREEDSSRQ